MENPAKEVAFPSTSKALAGGSLSAKHSGKKTCANCGMRTSQLIRTSRDNVRGDYCFSCWGKWRLWHGSGRPPEAEAAYTQLDNYRMQPKKEVQKVYSK